MTYWVHQPISTTLSAWIILSVQVNLGYPDPSQVATNNPSEGEERVKGLPTRSVGVVSFRDHPHK
jgi:hypothetical protein